MSHNYTQRIFLWQLANVLPQEFRAIQASVCCILLWLVRCCFLRKVCETILAWGLPYYFSNDRCSFFCLCVYVKLESILPYKHPTLIIEWLSNCTFAHNIITDFAAKIVVIRGKNTTQFCLKNSIKAKATT